MFGRHPSTTTSKGAPTIPLLHPVPLFFSLFSHTTHPLPPPPRHGCKSPPSWVCYNSVRYFKPPPSTSNSIHPGCQTSQDQQCWNPLSHGGYPVARLEQFAPARFVGGGITHACSGLTKCLGNAILLLIPPQVDVHTYCACNVLNCTSYTLCMYIPPPRYWLRGDSRNPVPVLVLNPSQVSHSVISGFLTQLREADGPSRVAVRATLAHPSSQASSLGMNSLYSVL